MADMYGEYLKWIADQIGPAKIHTFRIPDEVSDRVTELREAKARGPISDVEQSELHSWEHYSKLSRLIQAYIHRKKRADDAQDNTNTEEI